MKNSTKKIITGATCAAVAITGISAGAFLTSARYTEKNSIGHEAAYSIAFNEAGIEKNKIISKNYDFEKKNGKYAFEVEFDYDGKEYDYIIDAKSGAVINSNVEKDDDVPPAVSSEPATEKVAESASETISALSLDEAKKIALNDAGLSASKVTFIKTVTDKEDGAYEIEFRTSTREYDYEIRISDGKILEKESEAIAVPTTANVTEKESAKTVNLDEAKKIALNDAGLSASKVTFIKTVTDKEDGTYEIEFRTSTREYDYEIRISDGKILEKESEAIAVPTTATVTEKAPSKSISLDEAKKIALNDAGLSASKVTFTKTVTDKEDGAYEIEFRTSTREYDYEIRISDGKILEKESEAIAVPTTAAPEKASVKSISLDEAKKIALNDAGLSASKVTFTKTATDKEDGAYEIEFRTSTREYDYEIRISDGKILEKESEVIAVPTTATVTEKESAKSVNLDEAKKIALDKAGLKASDVRFVKAKLENEDGISVYEIEFVSGLYEYEAEINASTGKIIDFSREIND